jgi:ribonuclease D
VKEDRPETPYLKMPDEVESTARLLEAWLYARAAEAEIAPSMLATRGDLKTLAAAHYHARLPALPLLEGWRRELVGQDLLDILEGKSSADGRRELEAVTREGRNLGKEAKRRRQRKFYPLCAFR